MTDFDGYYSTPPPDDPVSGVSVAKLTIALPQRFASIDLEYIRASGAVDHSETVTLMREEFDAFASRCFAVPAVGRQTICALVEMNRLPNVSTQAPADSPAEPAP